jgi:hypothetical protein
MAAKKSSDINVLPWCPFCGQTVDKPKEPEGRKLGEFPVGRCQCGAVYACDATGWNVGAAMIEAMVYACNDNWDLAWDLNPEEDYLTDRIERYDEITNQVVETGNLDGRKIKGVLYFVRLQGEITGLTEKGKGNELPKIPPYVPVLEAEREPKRTKKRATKPTVQSLVEAEDIDGLVDLTFDDVRVLRFMLRLLYSIDESLRWKAINALGKVGARIATRRPGKISDLLHRLFAACSDSASSGWGNIEAIGAIIGERPDIFGSFSHHLLNFFEDPASQVSTLWALGSIAKHRPDLIRKMPFYRLFCLLEYADPNIRGNALRLFARIQAGEARSKIENLLSDQASVTIYEEGRPMKTTIAELARTALDHINKQGEK